MLVGFVGVDGIGMTICRNGSFAGKFVIVADPLMYALFGWIAMYRVLCPVTSMAVVV
jgi:hypothetical protein